MRILLNSIVMLAVCVMVCGCNKEQEEKIKQMSGKLAVFEEQVAGLKVENLALREEIDKLKSARPETIPEDLMKKLVASQMSAVMSNKLENMAIKIFEERIGSEEDIELIFRQTLEDGLAMAEDKKKEEQKEAAEKRRKEGEARREKWNQQRIDRMTKEMGLPDEKKEAFAKIQNESSTKMRETMREIWNKKGMDVNAMREARIAQTKETEDQMREVLSEEEFSSYTNTQARQTGWIQRMESLFIDRGDSNNRQEPPTPPLLR